MGNRKHIPFERQDDGTLKRLVGIAIYSSPKDIAMLEEQRLKKITNLRFWRHVY
jgi:hypothetical protein